MRHKRRKESRHSKRTKRSRAEEDLAGRISERLVRARDKKKTISAAGSRDILDGAQMIECKWHERFRSWTA